MKTTLATATLLLVLGAASAHALGEAWSSGGTGRGTARWTSSGARLTYRGGADFAWAVVDDRIADGWAQARFRTLGGRRDRVGGVVWRRSKSDSVTVFDGFRYGERSAGRTASTSR